MNPRTPLESLFLENGSEFSIPAHHRIIAEGQDIWLLVEGDADLFFIDITENDKIKDSLPRSELSTASFPPEMLNGTLTYIHHYIPGDYLIPYPSDANRNTHLLLRANSQCRWIKLSKDVLQKSLQDSKTLKEEMQEKIYLWFANFSWLNPYLKPESSNLEISEAIAAAHASISQMDSSVWQALDTLHRQLLTVHLFKKTHEYEREQKRTALSRKLSKQNLEHAFSELQTILETKEYLYREENPDLLFMACQLVANFLHVPFKPSQITTKMASTSDYIRKLCADAGIYHREIKLREGWWEHNLGPFVGFFGPNSKPVALLPVGINRYQMIDVEKHTVQIVDEKVDAELSLVGYLFYRPFPDKALSFKDLFNMAVEGKGKIYLKVIYFGALVGLLNLFIPFAASVLYGYIIPFSDSTALVQLFLGLLVILISSHVFMFARDWLLVYLDGKIEHDLIMAVWLRIFALPIKFFKRFEVGDLIIKAFAIESLRFKLAGPNLRALINSFFSILYLLPMLYLSPFLTFAGLMITLPVVIISFYIIIQMFQGNIGIVHLQQQANSHVLQFLTGISKIRNAGAENTSFVLWENIYAQIKKRQWKLIKLFNHSMLINSTISHTETLFIFAALLLAMNAFHYEISLGNFLAFTTAFGFFLPAILDFFNILMEVNYTLALWKISKVLLVEPLEIDNTKVPPPNLSGEIIVDRLKFRYEKDGPLILDDVSLFTKPNEFIAIVGPSGCGKTTLARLLIGFEIPESGAIYYEGKDIATLNLRQLRSQIGTILQTSKLLDGNLRINVSGEGTYTDDEIKNALALAGFEEDLKRLPMGLYTDVSNEGNTFSGGQIQRILIARALINKPKILIFDEATAALDNQTQDIIQRNLFNLNVTRIIIAHRLSTIKQAHRIYFLNKGKIMETGTFQELMQKQGHLYKLINKQNYLQLNEI